MEIKANTKYQVVIECHYFSNNPNAQEENFVLFPGEEYTVEFLFDRGGIGFAHLGIFENESGRKTERVVGFDIFRNCFKEVL